jgi:putative transposase
VIHAEKANYQIAWMCRLLRVPRSSCCAWRGKAETATAARRRELAVQVRRVFGEGRGAYGCRRVAAQLNRDGHRCSVGLVADLMRELGLRACQPRAYKRTTVPGEQPVSSPDLIGRDFTAAVPGQRLVGDITYVKTGEGWLYLATVIDLSSRKVAGWALADHMRTSLVTGALDMAITHGHVQPGAIFHSDKGAQGGFNWSSQHLDLEVWRYGCREIPAGDSCDARPDAVAGPPAGGEAGAYAAVLGCDRPRAGERGRGGGGRRVAAGRDRWFREAGGMPPITQAPLSGRYLSFAEREETAILRAQQRGVREIARRVGRSPSTISRELRRNASTPSHWVGVSGDDRAMACRTACQPAQGGQDCCEHGAARLRAGSPGRGDHHACR